MAFVPCPDFCLTCRLWLQDVGYQHGKTLFDVWQRSGVVSSMMKDRHQEEFHKTKAGHVSVVE